MSGRRKQTAARVPIAPILLVAFIGVPLAEIAVFIEVGDQIGLGPTLALIVLTAIIGATMLRYQGFAVLRRAQRQLDQGAVPVREVFEGLCLLVAGALLLTPGFITDALGALLLVPPVRHVLYRQVRRRLEVRVAGGPTPQGGPRPSGGPTIDAEFEEVSDEPPEPAGRQDSDRPQDDQRRMPPPRGGWDRPS